MDQLRKPVFLAPGRYDYQVAPYATWEPYRKFFYDLTLRVFDHSAHTPQLEESSHFNREFLEWLKVCT